jgi:hypothetical protein
MRNGMFEVPASEELDIQEAISAFKDFGIIEANEEEARLYAQRLLPFFTKAANRAFGGALLQISGSFPPTIRWEVTPQDYAVGTRAAMVAMSQEVASGGFTTEVVSSGSRDAYGPEGKWATRLRFWQE